MCKGGMGGMITSGLSATQNISNGLQANATAKGNAKTVQSVARVQSQKIKEQGRQNASSARAAAAENGIDVDTGAAALIQDEIVGDAAYNAEITKSDASNQASQIRMQGRQQRRNYTLNAASDLVDMGENYFGGWK